MLHRIALAITEAKSYKKIKNIMEQFETAITDISPEDLDYNFISDSYDVVFVEHEHVSRRMLKEIQEVKADSAAPVFISITSSKDTETHAMLIASGFDAVLCCTYPAKKIKLIVSSLLEKSRIISEANFTKSKELEDPSLEDFVSQSPAMREFTRIARRVVKSSSTVLILGETGVGKERLAHAIHSESARSDGAFIAVNCGALPENLLESELFGHELGAFTGAEKARRGCFEMAHQGTLFLDEIGDMPIHLQVKLLRVLENREIKSLGSEKTIPIDVRIMAATNRDLEKEVQAKRFRQDLFYRLNVVSLTIPPLRDRKEDIPELVESYIRYLGPKINSDVTDIEDSAMEMLVNYSWPGNVRELINIIERAMLLAEADFITPDDLPASLTGMLVLPHSLAIPNSINPEEIAIPEKWLNKPLKEASKALIEQFEPVYLASLLRLFDGRIDKTAQKAGIDQRTLFNKMKYYGIDKSDFKS